MGGGLCAEVKINSKGAFGTQPSGLYREVVSVQRSKPIAKEPTKWVFIASLWIQGGACSFDDALPVSTCQWQGCRSTHPCSACCHPLYPTTPAAAGPGLRPLPHPLQLSHPLPALWRGPPDTWWSGRSCLLATPPRDYAGQWPHSISISTYSPMVLVASIKGVNNPNFHCMLACYRGPAVMLAAMG